jgi:spermidine synthase
MKPFETVASVTTPEGRSLTLHRRDREYFIHLDGEELMSSRRTGSETALAERVLSELPEGTAPRILIGGLGLGFTLRAALAVLPREAKVVVAEIFPAVVAWNRNELAELGTPPRPLDDRRVHVREEDVAAALAESSAIAGDVGAAGRWDAILLDVDNGPSAWCLGSNSGLYDRVGLERIRRSLNPGGILGIWSAYADAAFLGRLRKAGFDADVETARDRGLKGARNLLFVARVGRSVRSG